MLLFEKVGMLKNNFANKPTRFVKDAFVQKRVVIAICTHNRSDLLMAALDAVSKLYVESYYDVSVLIVENEVEPKLGDILGALDFPFTIYHVHEPKLGLVSARNRSFDEAERLKADWLCLLDDDDEVHEDWLVRFEQAASEISDCEVFIGRDEEKLPPDYSTYIRPAVRPNLKLGATPTLLKTGNCMIKKPIFHSSGHGYRFDNRFNLSGGEDTEFLMRLRQSDIQLCHVPEAILYDLKHGEKTKYSYHFRRKRWEHTNLYFIYRIHFGPAVVRRMLVRDLNFNMVNFCFDVVNGALKMMSDPAKMRIQFGSAGLRIAKMAAIFDYCFKDRPTPYDVT